MSGGAIVACAVAACMSGAAAVYLVARLHDVRRRKAARREAALGREAANARRIVGVSGAGSWSLRYCESLTRRLLMETTEPIVPSVKGKRAGRTRVGMRFKEQAVLAGCSKSVTVSAFCEARARLGLAGVLTGALAGAVFSTGMAALLALIGGIAGVSAPGRAVKAAKRERTACAERHLSEMLEVVALGLRSGLTFDRSFALYGSHFDNAFALSCAKAYRCWALGLMTRDEALGDLSRSYECDQLARVVDGIVRSLRFGASLAGVLEDAAAQSRATYQAALGERVAKAPVKMMLPTGTLILPAMLLLVLGPVLLEMAGGF